MTIREGLKKLYIKIIGSEPNGKTVRAIVEELANNYPSSGDIVNTTDENLNKGK